MNASKIINIENLTKNYVSATNQNTLDGINLDVKRGSTVAVIGESGSGKSTLLNILAGLEPPSSGQVKLDGVPIWDLNEGERSLIRRNLLSIVFQSFNLINSLTVWENISFQARLAQKWDTSFAENLLEASGLKHLRNSYPDQISGGEQQRVAILRAIAARPKILLADEPTGNLDENNSEIAANLLLQTVSNIGSTLIVATHSQAFASKLDICLKLENGKLNLCM